MNGPRPTPRPDVQDGVLGAKTNVAFSRMTQGRKKKIFLTGATGNWGQYILREFASRADRFDVLALVLPTPKDTAIIRKFEDMDNLSVVYGDVTDYPTVLSCVTWADYVLHTGAIVSPIADDHPELTHKVNVGGSQKRYQGRQRASRP